MRLPKVFKSKGVHLFGMLDLPSIEKPPLVILFHGFASHKIGTNRSHVKVAEALVKKGIAALRFDYRAHGESEGDPEDVTIETLLSDAMNVISQMQEEGFDRIALFGSSLGGSLASIIAERQRVKTVALWAPVASGELWLKDFLAKKVAGSLESYRGFPINNRFREEFLQMNAAEAIGRIPIPLFHAFGEKDEVLSIQHKVAFEEKRKNAKNQFLTYPEAGHYLGLYPKMGEVAGKIAHWFSENL